MPQWATFAGFAGVVLALLLLLARASASYVSDGNSERSRPGAHDPAVADTSSTGDQLDPSGESIDTSEESIDDRDVSTDASEVPTGGGKTLTGFDDSDEFDHWTDRMHASQPSLSTMALLANVAVSQGAFGFLLVVGAWLTQIPVAAFGLSSSTLTLPMVGVGLLVGLVLYVANEAGSTVGERLGLGVDEGLREALAPSTPLGWVVLLGFVLPTIAGFEELLFRGALIGVFAAGFGVSPWLLAALSSVAFAVGHGAQGPAGMVVTGLLGFALAATFVVTGSLVVVIVAHYLVNALEFVVHEGLDVEWG